MTTSAVNRFDSEELSKLLSGARAGSSEAFGQLFESQREYLHLIASEELLGGRGFTHSPSDLVQWTAMEAVRDFHRFRGRNTSDFRFWLRRIMLNNLADCRRRVRVPRHAILRDLPGNDPTPESALVAEEQRGALRTLILELPPDEQRVIQLRYLEGKSCREIAGLIGRTPVATRKLWSRAVVRLNRILQRREYHP